MSPTLWVLLGLVFLAPIIGSGPHWPSTFGKDIELCGSSWLSVVLFYNNWHRYTEMCLPQTWYLSADLQLYVLGTFCVYIIYRNPSLGLKICFGGIVLSGLWLGVTVLLYDLQPTMIWETLDEDFRDKMLDLTYLGVMPHLGPFLIGVLTGYLVHTFPEFTVSKLSSALYWSLSIICMGFVVFAAHPWHNGQWPSKRDAALYQGSHKIVWAFATCWILLACHKGWGGILLNFLSWSGFRTLSKLSFIMSLINVPLIRFKNSVLRRQVYFGFGDMYYDFLGHYTLSIVLSVVLYLLVESPFASLTDSYFKQEKKKKDA